MNISSPTSPFRTMTSPASYARSDNDVDDDGAMGFVEGAKTDAASTSSRFRRRRRSWCARLTHRYVARGGPTVRSRRRRRRWRRGGVVEEGEFAEASPARRVPTRDSGSSGEARRNRRGDERGPQRCRSRGRRNGRHAVALGDDVLAGADGDAVHAGDERGAGLLGEGLEQGVVADRGGDEAGGVVVLGNGADVRHGREASTAMARRFFLRARDARGQPRSQPRRRRPRARVGLGGDPIAGARRGRFRLVARRKRKRRDGRLGVEVLERDATVGEAGLRATHVRRGGRLAKARSACAGGCDDTLTTDRETVLGGAEVTPGVSREHLDGARRVYGFRPPRSESNVRRRSRADRDECDV